MGTPRSAAAIWYEEHVLSFILERGMRGVDPLRAELLAPARGRIIEIGFGTGTNLPYYPEAVTSLVAVEPSAGLARVAEARLRAWGRPYELIERSASNTLPLPDQSVDAAVLTFVLCSVRRVPELLAELRRLLRPGAPVFIAEHVVAQHRLHAGAQRALRPLWRACLGGCDPARDSRGALEGAGFDTEGLTPRALGLPWPVRPGLVGVARRR